MIRILPLDSGELVALCGQGKLTQSDYRDVLIPRLKRAIELHGDIRLLCVLGEDFEGVTAAAAWTDLKFDLEHRKDFDRIAIVTDSDWVRTAMRMAQPFFSGELRLFPLADRLAAERWIQARAKRPAQWRA